MATVSIPNTDLMVSSVCLGTGGMGTAQSQDASFRLLDDFLALGGTFLDTAHVYGDWVPDIPRSASERMIGAWMQSRGSRDQIVLATKGAHWHMDKPDIPRLAPTDIITDIDESLAALQTDRIDLYWLHRDDPTRPVAEIMDTLNAQQKMGKIRYFGASNWRVPRIREAQEYAVAQGLNGFVADQPLWNAAVLAGDPYGDPTVCSMDEDHFAYHAETGMAAIPFQSQAFGLFQRMANGTLDKMNPGFLGFYKMPETQQRFERMQTVMAQTGLSITQVVLGYLMGQPFVTVPIIGSHTPVQVADSMTASDVHLTPEQISFIEEGEKEFAVQIKIW